MCEYGLEETWQLCLEMWKWIAENYKKGENCVASLKRKWLETNGIRINDRDACCFFCQYAHKHAGCTNSCPGKLVNKSFECFSPDYHYSNEPTKFYEKLVELNEMRLKMNLQERLIQCQKDKSVVEQEEKKLLQQIKDQEKTYKIGDWFEMRDETKVVLACCGDYNNDFYIVIAVCIDGTRWRREIKVKDMFKITKKELDEILGTTYNHRQIQIEVEEV